MKHLREILAIIIAVACYQVGAGAQSSLDMSNVIGGKNYTAVRTYCDPGGVTSYTDVTYYNGLGLPEQEMLIGGASEGRNLVTPVVYDEMMRPDARAYLPFPSNAESGMYISNVLEAHRTFYYNEGRPFRENTFESGGSGRLLTSQKPGDLYHDSSRNESVSYGVNDGSEMVLDLRYSAPPSGIAPVVFNTGPYSSGKLMYTMSVSEDRDTSYVFTDIFDKVILRRDMNDGTNHDTYFIYDLKDSLVCVIQPEGSAQLGSSFNFSDTFCSNYCFLYTYDERGNIIEKQIPGAGKEVMAYDIRNRMVLFADAEMQLSGRYKYIFYDSLDRIAEEGYASLNTSIENVRNAQRNDTSIGSYLSNKMITRTVTYYKTSSNNPTLSIPSNSRAYRQGIDFTHCLTLPAIEYIYEEPFLNGTTLSRGNLIRTKTCFYDSKGRLTLMTESDSDGWKSLYSWQNDFAGNVIKHTEEHYKGNVFDSMVTTYTYDKRGQRLTMQRNLNGKDYAPVSYEYDDYGRVRVKDVAGRGTEVYGYNLQGWQESIAADFYGYDVFSQTMNYQIPFMETSEPRYDGMISEVRHRHLNKDIQTVNYKYDGIRRLVDSEHFVNWDSTACNFWTESSIVYDLNGNIKNISRKRDAADEDIIAVTHLGNRMAGSRVNGGATDTYSYYSDGNLKQDNRRDLQFVYNLLNLPSAVTDASGQTVKARYSYLADGTKLSVRDAQNDGLSYRGSFVYTVDGTAGSAAVTEKLESIAHDEGRFVALSASAGATTTQFIDTWHVRDHLGSVRTVLDITRDTSEVSDPTLAILEQNDYLPFGTRIDLDSLAYDQSNRYRFNGKEEQVTGNIGLTDYGARFYDNTLPRWTTPDPLAEKYYSTSPYVFCNNSPVNFVDPDGMREWPVNPQYNGFIRRHENNYRNPRPKHNGVDINIGAGNNDLGAPVYATHDGVVTRYVTINDDSNAGGNRIQITSENGEVASYYMHLNSMSSFKVGDYITEGTIIGTIGGSGKGIENAYAPHLHYELKIDGEYVNPAIDSQKLIDPQIIITPVDMGMLSPAIVEGQGKPMTISLPIVQILLNQEQKLNYEIR